jgi:YD repeat-containing protein
MPSGLNYYESNSRSVTLNEPGNPLSVKTITDSTSIGNDPHYATTYDAAFRKVTTSTGAGRRSFAIVEEKGRVVSEETSGLAATTYERDEKGRVTNTTTGTGENARSVSYTYDLKDRITKVTDHTGRATSFEYDAAGRVTRQTLPDVRVISYSYDENGNLIRSIRKVSYSFLMSGISLALGCSFMVSLISEEMACPIRPSAREMPPEATAIWWLDPSVSRW